MNHFSVQCECSAQSLCAAGNYDADVYDVDVVRGISDRVGRPIAVGVRDHGPAMVQARAAAIADVDVVGMERGGSSRIDAGMGGR